MPCAPGDCQRGRNCNALSRPIVRRLASLKPNSTCCWTYCSPRRNGKFVPQSNCRSVHGDMLIGSQGVVPGRGKFRLRNQAIVHRYHDGFGRFRESPRSAVVHLVIGDHPTAAVKIHDHGKSAGAGGCVDTHRQCTLGPRIAISMEHDPPASTSLAPLCDVRAGGLLRAIRLRSASSKQLRLQSFFT